jgi:hypothetical protein
MYSTKHVKGPTFGKDVQIAKFAVHRYEKGLLPKPVSGFTKNYGPALEEALRKVIQPREGIPASGNIGQATWDVLWEYLDDYRRWQYRLWTVPVIPAAPKVPDLGPLYIGGPSLLNYSPTHNTDGIPHYIAFDTGWVVGRVILAPETLRVTSQSSSAGGDAFYAEGESKLKYWFGHLTGLPATGAWIRKGQRIGAIAWMPSNLGDPHVHIGIDARPLIGRDLLYGRTGYGPDYTWGSPSIGVQLREGLSLEGAA